MARRAASCRRAGPRRRRDATRAGRARSVATDPADGGTMGSGPACRREVREASLQSLVGLGATSQHDVPFCRLRLSTTRERTVSGERDQQTEKEPARREDAELEPLQREPLARPQLAHHPSGMYPDVAPVTHLRTALADHEPGIRQERD